MAKTAAGNTIVVAGGGGAGGSKGGGGSSGSGNGGDSKPSGGGGSKGAKLKIDDNLFNAALLGLAGIGAIAYIYTTRPDLVSEFIGTITGNKAATIPPEPTGTVQNDQMPQAPGQSSTGNLPYNQQGGMQQPQQQMNYPQFPQQNQGSGYPQFQYPQQGGGMMNIQQYQPYQPTNYGGDGGYNTNFNPAFGQNSNQPTYSFAARRRTKLEYDSSDGLITRS